LHHTSFLWDYDPENMRYLLLPKKRPAYREDRDHEAFLCKLRDHFSTLTHLQEQFFSSLDAAFRVHAIDPAEIAAVIERPHRKATQTLA
jgi:lipoate-protein ligase A